MTIKEAIDKVDKLKPNNFSNEEKIEWLSTLDQRVCTQILDAHMQKDPVHFYGYDGSLDMGTELLVPAPYDAMYLRWLEAMIEYHNSEDERYNNAILLFNVDYEGYKKHYTRTHIPKSHGKRFIF